ncbi:MAG: terpene cyclase/mutase family protein [Planctomycetes bacterium]|nr:terpene cyclase/mutase family protein [Planctomycetota bacterium]
MTDPVAQPPRPRRRRDFATPVLLTASLHLMAFTLFINHRLFTLLQEPEPGIYVMRVGDVRGADPDEPETENDPGAAAGNPAEQAKPAAGVAEILNSRAQETVQLPERESSEKPADEDNTTPPADPRTLGERLEAAIKAAGGGAGSEGNPAIEAGGGSHGLRGASRHGVGLKRHGGSAETEDAVLLGLQWLASVQDSDGRWDSDGYMSHYLRGAGPVERGQEGIGWARNDVGITGLCLLAFTGAGHTDTAGDFRATVLKAREFLLWVQRPEDGGFGAADDTYRADMYSHAIATLALTDLYLQNGDPALRTPMRRALLFLLDMQGPGGGWDYHQRYPTRMQGWEPSQRNDLSITGWAMLALAAGREAGFDPPLENLKRLSAFLKDCTQPDGNAVYADRGTREGDQGLAMMAVNNFSRRLLGEAGDSATQRVQLERMSRNLPDGADCESLLGSNSYYWYYGSLALLVARDQPRGVERWREWNTAMQKAVLPLQAKAGPRKGSFEPKCHWAKNGGGRLYSTALSVLTLEIYYRYEPEYVRAKAGELSGLWAGE